MKKAYIITFDKIVSLTTLHNIIGSLHDKGYVEHWCRYVSNSYIVISTLNFNQLNEYIGNRLNSSDRKYLVIEVDLNNCNGWMPNEAWEWIRKGKKSLSDSVT